MPAEPYLIFGPATDVSGNPISGRVIELVNENSGEVLTFVSNAQGEYQFDANNFPSGWQNGDVLTLRTSTPTFEIYASHNAGLSWYQMDNREEYAFDVNSVRLKIDSTNYPGGRAGIIVIYPI